jgi:hypothetical protein
MKKSIKYSLDSENILQTKFKEGTLIFHIMDKSSCLLNETGSFILDLIAQGKTYDEIVSRISKQFSISITTAKNDTKMFISQLKSMKILKEAGDVG